MDTKLYNFVNKIATFVALIISILGFVQSFPLMANYIRKISKSSLAFPLGFFFIIILSAASFRFFLFIFFFVLYQLVEPIIEWGGKKTNPYILLLLLLY